MTQRLLPPIARAILARLLHGAERDEVLEEVSAEYVQRSSQDGSLSARLWLWRQVMGSVPGLMSRTWQRGMTGFESDAHRTKGETLGMESWIQDIRYALRSLWSRPQYVILSVLTLALGIGGTAAIFGVARKVLLDPLPYRSTGELAVFWNQFDWSEAEINFLRPDWTGFASVAAYRPEDVFLQVKGGPPRLVPGIASTAELFDVLGTAPALGTAFPAGADLVGAEPTAILSYGLWKDLGGDERIIGTVMPLDGQSRRITGVMPAGFWFPDPSIRVWLSTPMRPDSRSGNYALIGRLAPGHAIADMTDPLKRITTRLGGTFTYSPQWDKTKNAVLTPLGDYILGPVRPSLIAALAAMAVILLMACANVAALMLGQLRGRSTELSVRVALGADRGRLTQQLLSEATMLGLLAGTFGGFVALAGFRILRVTLPLGALAETLNVDWTLFAAGMAVALGSALLIAMIPVFSLWRGELRDTLATSRTGGIGGRGGRIEDGLVLGEVALAVLLAATSALLIRSVSNLHAVQTGVVTQNVAVVDVISSGEIPAPQRIQQVNQMLDQLRSIPGVTSAAAINRLPIRDRGDNWGIQIQGSPDAPRGTTAYRMVTRDYFQAMGIPLKSGRFFDQTDRADGEPVVIIDETLAKKYYPGQDPLGRLINQGMTAAWARVIGVVGNVAYTGLRDELSPGRYMLLDQLPYVPEAASLVVKLDGRHDAAAVLQEAGSRIQGTMATVALRDVTTMDNVAALAMGPTRRVMQLITMLGSLALVLSAVGVYGVISHFVNRRKRDWVIRIALGMEPLQAVGQVVGRGAVLVSAGCAIGLVAAFALTRLLTSLLYNVTAADPLALAGATLTLIVTGCIAAMIPGLRASRVNPAAILKDAP